MQNVTKKANLIEEVSAMLPYPAIDVHEVGFEEGKNQLSIQAATNHQNPCCINCGSQGEKVAGSLQRSVQDLPVCGVDVEIDCTIRRIECGTCKKVSLEDVEFLRKGESTTDRLARYINQLTDKISTRAVANYFDLSWRTVNDIADELRESDSGHDEKILGFDLLPRQKSAVNLIVSNYETGEVIRNIVRPIPMISKTIMDWLEAIAKGETDYSLVPLTYSEKVRNALQNGAEEDVILSKSTNQISKPENELVS